MTKAGSSNSTNSKSGSNSQPQQQQQQQQQRQQQQPQLLFFRPRNKREGGDETENTTRSFSEEDTILVAKGLTPSQSLAGRTTTTVSSRIRSVPPLTAATSKVSTFGTHHISENERMGRMLWGNNGHGASSPTDTPIGATEDHSDPALSATEFGPSYTVHTSSLTGSPPSKDELKSPSDDDDAAKAALKATKSEDLSAISKRSSDASSSSAPPSRHILSDSMRDEVVASIEPLPEETPLPQQRATPSQAGAFAVSIARFTSPPPPNNYNDNDNDSDNDNINIPDVTIGSTRGEDNLSDLENQIEVDSLVEAELVDDSTVVHAERLKETPEGRKRLALAIGCLFLVVAVVVVAVVTWTVTRRKSKQNNMLPQEEEVSDDCIQTHQDLYQAVSAYYYYQDYNHTNSSSSSVSFNTSEEYYSKPIGEWCIYGVENFASVFSADRTQLYDPVENLPKLQFEAADIGDWDMSHALDFEDMFAGIPNMTADWGIDRWDISKVTNMKGMFTDTQWGDDDEESSLDLSSWNTSSVTSFRSLFFRSTIRTPGVGQWDISKVQTIYKMFDHAKSFNEDISGWNLQVLRTMSLIFKNATSFNQPLASWKTTSVTAFRSAFNGASSFNQPLDTWDVSKTTNLNWIFQGATSFNQDISMWDVSRVNTLRQAFSGARNFSQNLCAWGAILPLDAIVTEMFHNTACPNTSDPILEEGGPFCFNCN